ncbi:hypothetical protein PROFUN_06130 [Planoprotostelium fungivorum]|uniref:Uncharacterized protein n=1 Tax=Planoprotostelium fungivorum TaxID=1890364 RepID=A0A2P6NPI1_9EUKA|nr:hypothetical protein PROFUN_06130 [Planoprotostelium fungivorum]
MGVQGCRSAGCRIKRVLNLKETETNRNRNTEFVSFSLFYGVCVSNFRKEFSQGPISELINITSGLSLLVCTAFLAVAILPPIKRLIRCFSEITTKQFVYACRFNSCRGRRDFYIGLCDLDLSEGQRKTRMRAAAEAGHQQATAWLEDEERQEITADVERSQLMKSATSCLYARRILLGQNEFTQASEGRLPFYQRTNEPAVDVDRAELYLRGALEEAGDNLGLVLHELGRCSVERGMAPENYREQQVLPDRRELVAEAGIRAVEHFTAAIEHGYYESCAHLGAIFLLGKMEQPIDVHRALRCLRQGEKEEVYMCKLLLNYCPTVGVGAPKDTQHFENWLAAAGPMLSNTGEFDSILVYLRCDIAPAFTTPYRGAEGSFHHHKYPPMPSANEKLSVAEKMSLINFSFHTLGSHLLYFFLEDATGVAVVFGELTKTTHMSLFATTQILTQQQKDRTETANAGRERVSLDRQRGPVMQKSRSKARPAANPFATTQTAAPVGEDNMIQF